MNRTNLNWLLLIIVMVLWLMRSTQDEPTTATPRPDQIEYQGQLFQLSKAYYDYEEYEEDRDALHPSENLRVAQVMMDATVPLTFKSHDALITAMLSLGFPGYGQTLWGDQVQPDGSSILGHSVEIPRANKERILIYEGRNGSYTLVDDFVAAATVDDITTSMHSVRVEGGMLVFSDLRGKEVLRRPFRRPATGL